MSLTSALRPVALPFGAGTNREAKPDAQQTRPFHHEINYLNLHRTLIRFQHLILLTPSPSSSNTSELSPLQRQIQSELWSPLPYHRTKWLHNVEGARTLLLQLERKAQSIRVQRTKYEAIKDLAEKRAVIKKLRHRIEDIGREVERGTQQMPIAEEEGDSLYDILQQQSRETEKDALLEGKPVAQVEEEPASIDELFSSSTTRRRKGRVEEPDAQASGFSNMQSTERTLLNSSREQEDITVKLVDMAVRLKQQSKNMQFSLEQDKTFLGRATQAMEVSVSSMEAASKNMQFLKRMSEEEGLFGRLKLYAIIFGMWVAAFLLVFVCPKLRF
ncbi:hypothetical protein LTR10_013525 [Elasticomyces elasticus]|uniref:t-SNARE coiled-coil homology domain-containing protein n=1 Tax=Exophiala sideris TaxID=1016849 RepID=A0ABR0JRH2_9EURO|nr:hypothetical protein LTR10_013525 [Elasticomyces elasticus]KAK5039662.1 hypothetical protein LTS07_000157 [Exophiala sideris]KAK5041214.1 hypothetical protein LTR13_002689 [Exophiala sideris]KAK5068039.1 hypothetical protein LTR69_000157 [Exophiala sideris]KAK5187341.1 hypothetical protein LTR44_000157 [Eurotiomycetes sp. CCFEE 6388]